MDFFKEQQERVAKFQAGIGVLSYEKHLLLKDIKSINNRVDVIDKLVNEAEVTIHSVEQSMKDFETYLAIKEGATTIDAIKNGIEEVKS